MIRFSILIKLIIFFFIIVLGISAEDSIAQTFPSLFPLQSEIAEPRLESADLNGDGISEVIAGGRVGPFRPVTDPFETKHARIDVFTAGVDGPVLLASSKNLHIIEDVSAGDIDGDGTLEIIGVGWKYLYVFSLKGRMLYAMGRFQPGRGELCRVEVADMDGDGIEEVFLVEKLSEAFEGSEVIPSRIFVVSWTGTGFGAEIFSKDFIGGIGDLAVSDLDGDHKSELIIEEGAEESGGSLAVFRFHGRHHEFISQRMILDSPGRVLSLTIAQLTPNKAGIFERQKPFLGFGTPDGRFGLLEFDGSNLIILERLDYPNIDGSVSDFVIEQSNNTIKLWRGIYNRTPGSSSLQWDVITLFP